MREIDVTFRQTCYACPEQYDIEYPGGTGYMRLRHGYLRVDDADGNTVLERRFPAKAREPEEEGFAHEYADGIFESEEMRAAYLTLAARKLVESCPPTIQVLVESMGDDNDLYL